MLHELLRDLVPSAARIGVLIRGATVPGPEEQTNVALIDALKTASRKLGFVHHGGGCHGERQTWIARLRPCGVSVRRRALYRPAR